MNEKEKERAKGHDKKKALHLCIEVGPLGVPFEFHAVILLSKKRDPCNRRILLYRLQLNRTMSSPLLT